MTKIKFKAWNKLTNQMGEVVGIDWVFENVMLSVGGTTTKVRFSDVYFLQYIGQYDENRKEICDGDIIEHGIEITVVKKSQGGEWVCKNGSIDSMISTGVEIEIIGNIYENPDLLTIREI